MQRENSRGKRGGRRVGKLRKKPASAASRGLEQLSYFPRKESDGAEEVRKWVSGSKYFPRGDLKEEPSR